MKIEMVSKQAHKFGGKILKKGSKFEATHTEARALTALGRAMTAEEAATKTAKRSYKRKDIQAAHSEPVVEQHDPVVERHVMAASYGSPVALNDDLPYPRDADDGQE